MDTWREELIRIPPKSIYCDPRKCIAFMSTTTAGIYHSGMQSSFYRIDHRRKSHREQETWRYCWVGQVWALRNKKNSVPINIAVKGASGWWGYAFAQQSDSQHRESLRGCHAGGCCRRWVPARKQKKKFSWYVLCPLGTLEVEAKQRLCSASCLKKRYTKC